MTRFYKMPGFTLANANLYTKTLLTLFLLAVLFGSWIAYLQAKERSGVSPENAAQWVLGNEQDSDAREIRVEKSYREILSITHEHVFTLPILLFVLFHLVAFCSIPEWAKIIAALFAFAAFGGSLAGMWLTRFADPAWSTLTICGGIGMLASLAGSALLILFEVWLARPLRRWRGLSPLPPVDPLFPRR